MPSTISVTTLLKGFAALGAAVLVAWNGFTFLNKANVALAGVQTVSNEVQENKQDIERLDNYLTNSLTREKERLQIEKDRAELEARKARNKLNKSESKRKYR